MSVERVFVAKIVAGGANPSSSRHSAVLTSTSSNTASTTRSASAACSRSDVPVRRARIASRSSEVSFPFATARSRLPAIRAIPASARARSGS